MFEKSLHPAKTEKSLNYGTGKVPLLHRIIAIVAKNDWLSTSKTIFIFPLSLRGNVELTVLSWEEMITSDLSPSLMIIIFN